MGTDLVPITLQLEAPVISESKKQQYCMTPKRKILKDRQWAN
jgi:hypothetical protein